MDDLHIVVACSRTLPRQFEMHFRTAANAEGIFKLLNHTRRVNQAQPEPLTLKDDFGAEIALLPDDIGPIFMNRVAGTVDWQKCVGMVQAKAQAAAQRELARDSMMVPRLMPAGPNGLS